MAITINGSTGIDPLIQNGNNISAVNSLGFRNRIINGDMRIDQRNNGASVNLGTSGASSQYTLDRWNFDFSQAPKLSAAQSANAPAGFSSSLLVTSLAATTISAGDYFQVNQKIEGFNTSDLAFGSASASTVTFSFWVKSSLTGSFSGALKNSAQSRSYPFSYTITAASTWEQKTVTIAGDTSGTWVGSTNGAGLVANFSLGMGSTFSGTANAWASSNLGGVTGAINLAATNAATWQITGVQLEAGTVATPFERRDYGRELMMCQRYYFKFLVTGGSSAFGSGFAESATVAMCTMNFPTSMRAAPTALETTGTATDYRIRYQATNTACSVVPSNFANEATNASFRFTVASGLTAGNGVMAATNSASAYLAWSAEL